MESINGEETEHRGGKWCCMVLGPGWAGLETVLVETLSVQGAGVTYPIASHP